MQKVYKIFVINPGSISTKVAYFENSKKVFVEKVYHPADELKKFKKIIDQYEFRLKMIKNFIKEKGLKEEDFDAAVGRGGLLKPIEGGTYIVNEKMLEDLRSGIYGEHASNLGAILAYELMKPFNKPAFIVDPVVVDEMEEIAKITGIPEIKRKSIFHALNQKAVARKVAEELGKRYEECNFVVVHLGGGISIGAHRKGKVVDVNNALNGDGPFTPERAGSIPAWDLIKYSKNYTDEEMKKKLAGKGGIVAHLGTNNMKEVEKRIKNGDKKAEFIFKAMAYNVAKWIGMMAVVLKGKIDAIILTGGLAYCELFINWVKELISFLGPIRIVPGEFEMEALAEGALRVLKGEEKAKVYK